MDDHALCTVDCRSSALTNGTDPTFDVFMSSVGSHFYLLVVHVLNLYYLILESTIYLLCSSCLVSRGQRKILEI